MDFKDSDVFKNFVHKDKGKIFQYIELLYNQKSQLNHIEDLQERKKQALIKANIGDKTLQEDLQSLRNDAINKVIFHYLNTQNSNKYALLVSDQQLFWQIQQCQMEPLDRSDKETLQKEISLRTTISERSKELEERISEMYRKIYQSKDEIEMAHDNIRPISPEKRLKQNV